jgi:colanic acid biosynthesis glycosyl transferase WcaI
MRKGAVTQGHRHPHADSTERPVSILLVNQSFWPDVVATAQQAHDLAKFLHSRGDRVTVVASRSLYGKKGSSLPPIETKDGVEIHRVSYNLFNKKGLFSRAVDYLRFNIAAAWKVIRLPRTDVVVCLTTPPFVALIGALLKAVKGTRFIFWTMDLYPDLPVEAGIISRNGLAHRILGAIDNFCLRRADVVVTLGRCMRDRIIAKGVPQDRIAMIHPWSDPDEIPELPVRRLELAVDSLAAQRAAAPVPCGPNQFRKEWDLGDRFVIQYSGNFGLGHDAETVFGAMLKLKDDDGIRWVIVGDGVMRPAVEEFVRKHDIQNVVLKPYQPRSRLGTLISLGDVHLVLMVPGFEGVILPSKLYGILAAGRPAIFVGPEKSEIARIIKEDNCGIVVPNGNSEGLVRVIAEIRQDPALGLSLGHRGRKALEAKYSMRHACEAWHRLIHGQTFARSVEPS